MTSQCRFIIFTAAGIGYHKSMEMGIRFQILELPKGSAFGLQMEEVAEKLSLTRHTLAKYIELLQDYITEQDKMPEGNRVLDDLF